MSPFRAWPAVLEVLLVDTTHPFLPTTLFLWNILFSPRVLCNTMWKESGVRRHHCFILPTPPPTPHSPRSPGPWEGGEVPTQPLTASVFDM